MKGVHKKYMKIIKRFLTFFAVFSATIVLCSCSYLVDRVKLIQGDYDDNPKNYPNTRWVCQEIDMYFDHVEGGQSGVYAGELIMDGVNYDITISLDPGYAHSFELSYATEDGVSTTVFGRKEDPVLNGLYEAVQHADESNKWICTINQILDTDSFWTYKGNTLNFVMEELPTDLVVEANNP